MNLCDYADRAAMADCPRPRGRVRRDHSAFDEVEPMTGFNWHNPYPTTRIPVFARSRYRYYLRITQILESISLSKTFTLGFEMHRFNGATASPMWTNEGAVTAKMTFSAAPAGYPAGAQPDAGAGRATAEADRRCRGPGGERYLACRSA